MDHPNTGIHDPACLPHHILVGGVSLAEHAKRAAETSPSPEPEETEDWV